MVLRANIERVIESRPSYRMSEVPDPSAAAVPEPFDHRTLLATLPELPGVYRVLDAAGTVRYVG